MFLLIKVSEVLGYAGLTAVGFTFVKGLLKPASTAIAALSAPAPTVAVTGVRSGISWYYAMTEWLGAGMKGGASKVLGAVRSGGWSAMFRSLFSGSLSLGVRGALGAVGLGALGVLGIFGLVIAWNAFKAISDKKKHQSLDPDRALIFDTGMCIGGLMMGAAPLCIAFGFPFAVGFGLLGGLITYASMKLKQWSVYSVFAKPGQMMWPLCLLDKAKQVGKEEHMYRA